MLRRPVLLAAGFVCSVVPKLGRDKSEAAPWARRNGKGGEQRGHAGRREGSRGPCPRARQAASRLCQPPSAAGGLGRNLLRYSGLTPLPVPGLLSPFQMEYTCSFCRKLGNVGKQRKENSVPDSHRQETTARALRGIPFRASRWDVLVRTRFLVKE